MTTSISSPDVSVLKPESGSPPVAITSAERRIYKIRHTLASRFAFLLLCVTIVLSALAFGTVHYPTMAVFSVGALAVLFLWVIDGWNLGTFRVSRNVLQLPLLALILLGCIQLLPFGSPEAAGVLTVPPVKTLSSDAYSTRLVLAQISALFIYFAAVLVFTDTPHRLRLLVRTIIVFGFFLAIFGLTQSFTSPTKVFWVRELAQSTAFGPFINRHHFAGYMELTLALPLGLLFSGAIDKDKRFVYLFAAGLMGVALIMTNSRGGIISLVAEILFLTALTAFQRKRHGNRHREHKKRIGPAVRVAISLGLIVVLFAGVVLLGGESALTRFVGTVNSDDPTTGRAHFWSVTLNMIKSNPWLGTGLGAFGVVYTGYDTRNGLYRLEQAHNDYLQVLSDGGIVGAALALFFVFMLFRVGFVRRETTDDFRRGVATGALGGCFAVLVHSFFDFTLHTTSNALLFLMMAALATMNGRVEEAHARHKPRRRRERAHGVVRQQITTEGSTVAAPSVQDQPGNGIG